jgi:hypothetical protein
MPVILSLSQVEMGGEWSSGQHGQQVSKIPWQQEKVGHSVTHLSCQLLRRMIGCLRTARAKVTIDPVSKKEKKI